MSHYDPESGLNTTGLNGRGRAISDIANHAILVLLSRLMAVLGVPVAGYIFWSIQADISAIRDATINNLQLINNINSVTAIHDTRLNYHDDMLSDHNIRLRVVEQRGAVQ